MGEWQTYRLGDICQVFDGPHATPTKTDFGPYFLNIGSLKNGRLDLSESPRIHPDQFAKWTRRVQPQKDDLLFSYETRLGEAALMPAGVEASLGRRMGILRFNRSKVDPAFFLYYWLSPEMQRLIEKNTLHGATVQRISIKDMPNWTVTLPSFKFQQLTSGVLRALDDKVLVNLRVFERIKAVTINLIGQLKADSKIPINALVDLKKTQIVPATMPSSVVHHYSLPAFDDGQRPAAESPLKIKSSKYLINKSALLFSKLNPATPRIWLTHPAKELPSVASTEFVVMESQEAPLELLWALCAQPEVTRRLVGLARGTSNSHQRVKPMDVLECPVIDPSTIPSQIAKQVESLLKMGIGLQSEVPTLMALRDTLLSRLMDGTLTVRAAENLVSEAV